MSFLFRAKGLLAAAVAVSFGGSIYMETAAPCQTEFVVTWAPKNVAFWIEIPGYFREISVGEILFHLARLMKEIHLIS